MKKPRIDKAKKEVQFTVIAPPHVRDRLRMLGAMNGTNLSRESGRRLTESISRDGKKPITLEALDA